jgi:hypothetical protein
MWFPYNSGKPTTSLLAGSRQEISSAVRKFMVHSCQRRDSDGQRYKQTTANKVLVRDPDPCIQLNHTLFFISCASNEAVLAHVPLCHGRHVEFPHGHDKYQKYQPCCKNSDRYVFINQSSK